MTPPSSSPGRRGNARLQAFRGILLGGSGFESQRYLAKWMLLGTLIGLVAGLGAVVFARAIDLCTELFLGRIVGYIPWQWRWIVAGIRLTRIVRKSAKKQMKQFNKLQRQMIRRVLPRQKAMRGARAR